jgi:hypothetical protein
MIDKSVLFGINYNKTILSEQAIHFFDVCGAGLVKYAGSRREYLWDYNSNKIMVPQVFCLSWG